MNKDKLRCLQNLAYKKNSDSNERQSENITTRLDDVHVNGDSSTTSTQPVLKTMMPPPAADGDAASNEEERSQRVWYIQSLFPDLDEEFIKSIVKSAPTLDEAEKLATVAHRRKRDSLQKDTDAKPKLLKKRKRIRMYSTSSNEEYSPVKPDKKRGRIPNDASSDDEEVPIVVRVSDPPVQVIKVASQNSSTVSGLGQAGSGPRPVSVPPQHIVRRHLQQTSGAVAQINSKPSDPQASLSELPTTFVEDDEDDVSSSDEEIVKSKSKREVMLKFFQEASLEDMIRMPRCSNKKADLIMSLRPFEGWNDLVAKFSSKRSLSIDMLHGCKELIEIRQVVKDLMNRCETMAQQMSGIVTSLTENDNLNQLQIKKQPDILNSDLQLKTYQMIGLNWLNLMKQKKVDGILADEMGLGKTAQSIAFMAHMLEQGNTGPHICIVPASTLDNWLSEINRWCPSLITVCYRGKQDERAFLRDQLFNEPDSYHILLTTYNVLTSTAEDKQIYKRLVFEYAIFDEAHMLKNMATARYKNLMKISAKRRLLLTGTPFQNDLVELMSLLCFVMPDMFVNKEDQLKRMFVTITTKGKEGNTSFELDRITHAKNIMKPFVLRRLKKDVLKELPKKNSTVEMVDMCPAQMKYYSDLAKKYRFEGLGPMSSLTDFRFAANHPLLLRRIFTDEILHKMSALMLKEPTHRDANADLIKEDMQVMSDFELHNLCKQYKSLSDYILEDSVLLSSGKFEYLDRVLPMYKEKDEKVLIFSQYNLILNILEKYLQLRDHQYIRLDGSTPVEERLNMIDEFNSSEDLFIFILSTRAGGLGINLTAANNVIIHDIDFNPHNDRQAEDRCHRVGQKKDVKVVRLVTRKTVEDAMLQTAYRKLELEQKIQENGSTDIIESKEDVATVMKEAMSIWTADS